MKRKLIPDAMFGHFWEITPAYLQSIGVRALLIDVDNTLAPYEQDDPDDRIRAWFEDLRESGVKAALVSNNHPPRVERFNRTLGLLAFADSHKPGKRTLLLAMRELGVTQTETAMLGDQLLTDTFAGKRLGLRALNVPPIRDKKNWFFRFKRLCERPFIRAYARENGYEPFMEFWKVYAPDRKEN